MAVVTGDWRAYVATETAWHGSDRVEPRGAVSDAGCSVHGSVSSPR